MFAKTLVTAQGNIDDPTWEQIEGAILWLRGGEYSVALLPADEVALYLTIIQFEAGEPRKYCVVFNNGVGGQGLSLKTTLDVARAFAERGDVTPV
jgi:hypothetical protein